MKIRHENHGKKVYCRSCSKALHALLSGLQVRTNIDRYGQMAAGATYGALIGYQTVWPFDGSTLFGASSATSNAIFWGGVGAVLGDMSHNSKTEQAVIQMRIWVQEAATGNLVWTNRIKVAVSPESVYADQQYDALFNSAIEKSVSTLIDNFVTYGL